METETTEVAIKAVEDFATKIYKTGLWAGRAEGALIVAGVGAAVFCMYCFYNLGVEDGRNTRNP